MKSFVIEDAKNGDKKLKKYGGMENQLFTVLWNSVKINMMLFDTKYNPLYNPII